MTWGGVFLNLETWSAHRCENANDLPVGIRTKAGVQFKTGYPTGAESEWGILLTAKIGGDFTQIFIIHYGRAVYIRGGVQSQVDNAQWHKYSPASTTIAPAE